MVPNTGVPLNVDLGPLLPHYLSEIIVGIILMLLIFLVMWKVIVPRFEKMYTERAEAIQGGIERAERAEAKAEAALAEYNNQLASARDEAAKIREAAKTQGAMILAESREAAQKEAARISENAAVQIAAERAQAMVELKSEVGGLATALAAKIVGEALDDDARAQRTVDRFLDELESQQVGQTR